MSDKVWFSKIGQWTDDAGEVMGANEYPTPNNTMGTTTPDAVVILTTEYERLKAIAERAGDVEGMKKTIKLAKDIKVPLAEFIVRCLTGREK